MIGDAKGVHRVLGERTMWIPHDGVNVGQLDANGLMPMGGDLADRG